MIVPMPLCDGIDPAATLHTPTGRPVELASGGKPVLELFS